MDDEHGTSKANKSPSDEKLASPETTSQLFKLVHDLVVTTDKSFDGLRLKNGHNSHITLALDYQKGPNLATIELQQESPMDPTLHEITTYTIVDEEYDMKVYKSTATLYTQIPGVEPIVEPEYSADPTEATEKEIVELIRAILSNSQKLVWR